MQRHVGNLAKFIALFLVASTIGQMLKHSLEIALINSKFLTYVPFGVVYISIITLPNFFFYTLIGLIFSVIIKGKILYWLLSYCAVELLWKFCAFGPYRLNSGVYGYMLIYFPILIIPFAITFGVWIHRKKGRRIYAGE